MYQGSYHIIIGEKGAAFIKIGLFRIAVMAIFSAQSIKSTASRATYIITLFQLLPAREAEKRFPIFNSGRTGKTDRGKD